MTRCVCCDRPLQHGEMMRKRKIVECGVTYIVDEDFCNLCIQATRYPDYHTHQLEHLTSYENELLSRYWYTVRTSDECESY